MRTMILITDTIGEPGNGLEIESRIDGESVAFTPAMQVTHFINQNFDVLVALASEKPATLSFGDKEIELIHHDAGQPFFDIKAEI